MSFPFPNTFDGKLKAVIVVTTVAALFLSLSGIVVYETVAARESLVGEMETLADVLGANGAAALAFQQPEAAVRILSSVEAKPHIVAGYFLTPEGDLFATYEKEAIPPLPTLSLPTLSKKAHFGDGLLALQRDIIRDAEKIGMIQLVSNLEPIHQKVRNSVIVMVAVLVGCAALALAISYRWLRTISQPIFDLAKTASQVSASHDYSLRAVKTTDDELGRLTDGFNQMLEQIENANRELQSKNQELARSNSDLERFAYVASHDLQEPLRVVTSYSALLEDEMGQDLSPDAKKYLDYVVSASGRMRTMIAALLDYSRIGSKGQPFTRVDCEKALEVALANLHLAVRDTAAGITQDDLPVVLGDQDQIIRLFQNLIGNSLKFHRPDVPPEIKIRALREENFWRLSFEDNGIGIAPEATEKVFDVFQRLHSRAEFSGTGIGLAICRRIVEHHGGNIGVDSVPGEGSVFHLTLPIVTVPAEEIS